jgi:uncharacterized membrane protein YccC
MIDGGFKGTIRALDTVFDFQENIVRVRDDYRDNLIESVYHKQHAREEFINSRRQYDVEEKMDELGPVNDPLIHEVTQPQQENDNSEQESILAIQYRQSEEIEMRIQAEYQHWRSQVTLQSDILANEAYQLRDLGLMRAAQDTLDRANELYLMEKGEHLKHFQARY